MFCRDRKIYCRIAKLTTAFIFLSTSLAFKIPSTFAQSSFSLPPPGERVTLSPFFTPPILKGIKVYPENPFQFDFVLDKGDSTDSNEQLKQEANRLIKYFLVSLTVPENDLWVNLSPYEKDRIVPDVFGQTEMGRDLLAQDYLLKQITAAVIYPEETIGKEFWDRVYKEAYAQYGQTDLPINTFNKVWIIPDIARIYENGASAFVVESHLKIMLEEDYLALGKNESSSQLRIKKMKDADIKKLNGISSEVVRHIVLPALEKEVNEGRNFIQLRQVYHSLILATWYKEKLKESILTKVYADRNKIYGINIDDKDEIEKIYQQYIQAFKQGAFNYIKEDYDPQAQQMIPRKYFSGGFSPIAPDGQMFKARLKRDGRPEEIRLENNKALVVSAYIEPVRNLEIFIRILRQIVKNNEEFKDLPANSSDDVKMMRLINVMKENGLATETEMPLTDKSGTPIQSERQSVKIKIITIAKEKRTQRFYDRLVEREGGLQGINFQDQSNGQWYIVGFEGELGEIHRHEQDEIILRMQNEHWIDAHNLTDHQKIDKEAAQKFEAGIQDIFGTGFKDKIKRWFSRKEVKPSVVVSAQTSNVVSTEPVDQFELLNSPQAGEHTKLFSVTVPTSPQEALQMPETAPLIIQLEGKLREQGFISTGTGGNIAGACRVWDIANQVRATNITVELQKREAHPRLRGVETVELLVTVTYLDNQNRPVMVKEELTMLAESLPTEDQIHFAILDIHPEASPVAIREMTKIFNEQPVALSNLLAKYKRLYVEPSPDKVRARIAILEFDPQVSEFDMARTLENISAQVESRHKPLPQWTNDEFVEIYKTHSRKQVQITTVSASEVSSTAPLLSFSYTINSKWDSDPLVGLDLVIQHMLQERGFAIARSDRFLKGLTPIGEEVNVSVSLDHKEIWNVGGVEMETMVLHGIVKTASGQVFVEFTINVQPQPTQIQITDAIRNLYPQSTIEEISETAKVSYEPYFYPTVSLARYVGFYNSYFVQEPERGHIRLVIRRHDPGASQQVIAATESLMSPPRDKWSADEIITAYEFARRYLELHPTHSFIGDFDLMYDQFYREYGHAILMKHFPSQDSDQTYNPQLKEMDRFVNMLPAMSYQFVGPDKTDHVTLIRDGIDSLVYQHDNKTVKLSLFSLDEMKRFIQSRIEGGAIDQNQLYLVEGFLTNEQFADLGQRLPFEIHIIHVLPTGQSIISLGDEHSVGNEFINFLSEIPEVHGKLQMGHNHPENANPTFSNLEDEMFPISEQMDRILNLRPSYGDIATAKNDGNFIWNSYGIVFFRVHSQLSTNVRRAFANVPVKQPSLLFSDSEFWLQVVGIIDNQMTHELLNGITADDMMNKIVEFYSQFGVYLKVTPWTQIGNKTVAQVVAEADQELIQREVLGRFEDIKTNVLNMQSKAFSPNESKYRQAINERRDLDSKIAEIGSQIAEAILEGHDRTQLNAAKEQLWAQRQEVHYRVRFMARFFDPQEVSERQQRIEQWLNIAEAVYARNAGLRKTDTPKKDEALLIQAMQNPGGIDFNPQKIKLETEGKGEKIQFKIDSTTIENMRIDGFVPIIINVQPLSNLPLFLGFDTKSSEEFTNSLASSPSIGKI